MLPVNRQTAGCTTLIGNSSILHRSAAQKANSTAHQRRKNKAANFLVYSQQQEQDDSPQPYKGDAIPTLLNNIPHPRETRRHFYAEVVQGVHQALAADEKRLTVKCTIPELNTEFDVYRVGTLLELVREIAVSLTTDGRKVKVCVQQPLGQGVFQGMPLNLNGVMRIMKQMDWGSSAEQISFGNLGAHEVEDVDALIVIAPQNIVGYSVLPFLQETADAAAAANKPILLVNANLKDVQSSGGVMSIRGRQGRLDYISTFINAYTFRLLYIAASMYPIMGALRNSFGGPWEVFKRVQIKPGQEEYKLIGSFDHEPNPGEITACFQVKK